MTQCRPGHASSQSIVQYFDGNAQLLLMSLPVTSVQLARLIMVVGKGISQCHVCCWQHAAGLVSKLAQMHEGDPTGRQASLAFPTYISAEEKQRDDPAGTVR